jgi:type 2 lantibiotic biosynthesis protein LanM
MPPTPFSEEGLVVSKPECSTLEALEVSLARILLRAAPLHERWAASQDEAADAPAAADLAARWQEVIAPGDDPLFARRLAWDGWDVNALGWLRQPDAQPLPGWADLLVEALAMPGPPPRTANAQPAKVPFADCFECFLAVARGRLAAAPGAESLSQAAWEDFSAALLTTLFEQANPSLLAAFGEQRGPEFETTGRACYDAFAATLNGAGWLAFFDRLPGLARLMGLALQHAIDAACEVVTRYQADRQAIGKLLGVSDPGGIARVEPGRSDPYRGGRSVWMLTTASGCGVVYKPRSLRVDEAFGRYLEWFVAQGLSLDLHVPAVIDRGSYGWAVRAIAAPCQDAAGVERYFKRAGMLLAAVYALDGIDFHCENVLAVGEQPTLLDLEGLLQPRFEATTEPGRGFDDLQALRQMLHQTVLQTALVAYYVVGPGGNAYNWGGLAGTEADQLPRPHWMGLETDGLRLELINEPIERGNLPRLSGQPCLVKDHVTAVRAGFAEAYQLLLAHQATLLSPKGPVADFADLPVRWFFRDTKNYVQLLAQTRRPEYLTDGLERSFALDRLIRTYRYATERPPLWPLLGAERRSLEQLDVPAFLGDTTSTALALDEGEVPGIFPHAPMDQVQRKIGRLSVRDQKLQERILAIVLAPQGDDLATGSAKVQPFQVAALALADRVAERVIPLGDGTAAWLSLLPVKERATPVPTYLEGGLWNGAPGLAVFLAAAGRLGQRPDLSALALATILPSRAMLADVASGQLLTPSGWVEFGEAVLALATIAPLVDAPGLATELAAACRALRSSTIEHVALPDVLGGLASLVFGLLAVAHLTADTEVLALARLAGERLLATDVEVGPQQLARQCLSNLALARLLAPPHAPQCAQELEVALASILAAPDHPRDCLCCGNFGRVDVLLEASRVLGRPDLAVQAATLANRRLAAYTFGIQPAVRSIDENLTFLRGLAGIGYVLLRLADKQDQLPCLLGGKS